MAIPWTRAAPNFWPMCCAIVGGRQTVRSGLDQFIAQYRPDEIMVTAQIFDAAARQRSYEILSEIHPPPGA